MKIMTHDTPSRSPLQRGPREARLVILVACLAGGVCGCTMFVYTGPGGERFTRTSLGAQTAIASLEVEAGTNGLRRLSLRGYQNETAQALGTVTEAAIRAALNTNR